jgi:hypothetical protein
LIVSHHVDRPHRCVLARHQTIEVDERQLAQDPRLEDALRTEQVSSCGFVRTVR